MSESTAIDVSAVHEKSGGLKYVLIGADDPAAMLQHTDACRRLGIDFISDPSQQLPRLDGEQTRAVISGAAFLFNNEYEASLIEQRTGWNADEVLQQVDVRVTTLGKNGARIQDRHGLDIRVPVAKEEVIKDPTGVGDAFRAGFLMGLNWGKSLERCAQIGSLLATYVIETVGTQEFVLSKSEFLSRLAEAYGAEAVADIENQISCPQP